MSKKVASRTLNPVKAEKSDKTFFYFINCIVQKEQGACKLKTNRHEQAGVSAHCYLQCSPKNKIKAKFVIEIVN